MSLKGGYIGCRFLGLNSLKGILWRFNRVLLSGDARSSDYSSYESLA